MSCAENGKKKVNSSDFKLENLRQIENGEESIRDL